MITLGFARKRSRNLAKTVRCREADKALASSSRTHAVVTVDEFSSRVALTALSCAESFASKERDVIEGVGKDRFHSVFFGSP